MAIKRWKPNRHVSRQEAFILKRCRKKRKLFSFLREHRSDLFDDAFQEELEAMYRDTGAGKSPVPPAVLAMATILQGYLGLSDADTVEMTVVDLRWQMVLDCLGATTPLFSQGALFAFRERMIEHEMDRLLLARTAEIARSSKGFDAKRFPKTLRIAVDSSPLDGAGRVEDSINLIGHAARKVVKSVALLLEVDFETVCERAGIPLLLEKSVKKALDCDWSDPKQKGEAVDILAKQVLSLERWISHNLAKEIGRPALKDVLEVLRQLMDQDLEPDPGSGGFRIARKVAKDRRISVEDGEMRHGRKSKSKRIDGYKRHAAKDLDSHAVLACAVTPGNQPEQEALPELQADMELQGILVAEAHFDRAYMGSPVVADYAASGAAILCKPWKARNGDLFSKEDFKLDLRANTITCPANHTASVEYGRSTEFDPSACDVCHLRSKCTTAALGSGRTVSIQTNERLQKKLRAMGKTRAGRRLFRERVSIEHTLAHIGQRQGPRARYVGTRKNLFDLRRAALIQNLEIVQRRAA